MLTAAGQSARAEPLLRQAAAKIHPYQRAQPRLALQLDAALNNQGKARSSSGRYSSSLALLRRLLWTQGLEAAAVEVVYCSKSMAMQIAV